VEVSLEITHQAPEPVIRLDALFGLLALDENLLSLLLVLPEIRLRDSGFEAAQDFLAPGGFKGNSARVRCAFGARRSDFRGLLESSDLRLSLRLCFSAQRGPASGLRPR